MRRGILLAVLGLAAVVFMLQFGQLSRFLAMLRGGQPRWVAAALLTQAVWQWLQAEEYRAALALAGAPRPLRSIIPVVLANNFILVAAPSGSLSTFALFLGEARLHRLSSGPVILGVALFAVAEAAAISLLAATGLALAGDRRATLTLLAPAGIIAGLAVCYGLIFVLAIRSPARLEGWAVGAAARLNRLARRELIPAAGLSRLLAELASDLARLGGQPPSRWLAPLLWGLLAKAALIGLLAVCGLAFGQALSAPALAAGAAAACALTIVSPTPQGLGLVEGALAYILTASGAGAEPAILTGLLYRGLTLWLPAVYGFAALQAAGLRDVFKPGADEPA